MNYRFFIFFQIKWENCRKINEKLLDEWRMKKRNKDAWFLNIFFLNKNNWSIGLSIVCDLASWFRVSIENWMQVLEINFSNHIFRFDNKEHVQFFLKEERSLFDRRNQVLTFPFFIIHYNQIWLVNDTSVLFI